MEIESVGTPTLWLGFVIFVAAALAFDLGVFHRKAHVVKTREALAWSLVWVTLALAFNLGVYQWFGPERALEFATGYLIELALSVDNLFVFLVIFSYFAVPSHLQHRVLFWGILGAVVMRIGFILAGTALIQTFHWVIYVFGGLLLLTGIKLLMHRTASAHPERNPIIRLFRRVVPMVADFRGARFVVKEAGRWYATPLLLVLVAVEATDIVFAVDSIPAIFGVTTDPFIVFTSNIFAILGLRAFYFLLAGMISRFRFLNVGLGIVLAFVGGKMLAMDSVKVPIGWSLGIVGGILTLSVVASVLFPKNNVVGTTDGALTPSKPVIESDGPESNCVSREL
jgi:tellurite resistance protein TerC